MVNKYSPLSSSVQNAIEEKRARSFQEAPGTINDKLRFISRFLSRSELGKILAYQHLIEQTKGVVGSIADCGVFEGQGLMTYALLLDLLEPYNYHSSDRLDWFMDFPITDVFGLLPEYIKFREGFIDQYKNLMDESYEDDFEPTEQMDAEEMKAIEEEKKQKKWAWEQLIWHLCNEDLTRFHAVCELPLILVFNFLGMKKELNV